MAHHVTGVFSDTEAADRAVHELIQDHFNAEEISILVTDQEGVHREGIEYDTGVAEGAVAGAALGGLAGAIGGSLVATGVVAGPGLMLLASGPILTAIKGAVVGAGAGFGFGAVGGLGFWDEESHIHADALKKGGVVIAVSAEHQHAAEAREILAEAGADAVRG